VSTDESHAYPQILGTFVELGLTGDAGWRRVLSRYDRGLTRDLPGGLHLYVDRSQLCELIADALAHEHSDEAAAERVVEGVFDTYFWRAGGSPDRVFVEKTPMHIFYAERILRRYPDARMIEVVRDGRDVSVSMQMLGPRQTWAPRDRTEQARMWLRYVRRGMELRENPDFAGRVLLVHYERVRADPVAEVRRMLEFAGLDASPVVVEAILGETAFERSKRASRPTPYRKAVVGNWREHFAAEDHAAFRAVVGDVLTRAGYDY